MDKKVNGIWPPVKCDFNSAVDRRKEPRGAPVYDLYFREVSGSEGTHMHLSEKMSRKN
jgi:hypothetical protein